MGSLTFRVEDRRRRRTHGRSSTPGTTTT